MSSEPPIRVLVIGGGCAALSAAYQLTRPELQGRYEVSVYQLGWRLGGKGASGRGPSGRIEEHGLHLWMGYYENAFRLMRECYAEWGRGNGGAPWTFDEAFSPANLNAAMDWAPSGRWLPWKVSFPATPGLPGDADPPALGVVDYLTRAAGLLAALLRALPTGHHDSNDLLKSVAQWSSRPLEPEDLGEALGRLLKYGTLLGLSALLEGVRLLELVFGALSKYPQSLVMRLLDLVSELARAEVAKLIEANDEARRLWEVVELLLAALRGAVRFRLAFDPRGFDAIDDYDSREWLKLNGASEEALNSAFIRALYDLAFAYEGGDPKRPAIAAGSALRGAFRAFFTYRGAFFWKLNAGMGDVVFAPLYQVLKRRGVSFHFFHKLKNIELSEEATWVDLEQASEASAEHAHVSALEFDVQAQTVSGGEYEPLIDVKGLPCWPARPRFSQLLDGEALSSRSIDFESQWDPHKVGSKTLRVSDDFDLVVLGVGLGVVPFVCQSLIERSAQWRNMVERVKSVPTQAFQLWLDRDVESLGWQGGATNVSGFVEPFDTWADMTHLIPREDWQEAPKTIAYFCNVLPDDAAPCATRDSEFVQAAYAGVRANAVAFLEGDIRELWPGAHSSGAFCWESLIGESRDVGSARFDGQFWTANVRPSDRYSQALPGTTQYRISPLDRTFDNLTVAGDWTSSGINMGCVEAAVMSGMLAAHAVSGFPALSEIVGYDHP